MTTDSDSRDVPLMPSVARRIMEELFQIKSQWRRADLAAEVERIHLERGGLRGSQDSQSIAKKALSVLEEDGKVDSPAYGQWRWIPAAVSGGSVDRAETAAPVASVTEREDLIIDKQLGEGPETVYLYFNPNDKKLAQLEGRDTWECKIGRTATGDPRMRVLEQGVRTALSRTPEIGLVLRTQDANALETALHASLRILEAQVEDSPGSEWFMTSPAHIESWYSAFQEALGKLRGSARPPG
jgi:hypothetical protein